MAAAAANERKMTLKAAAVKENASLKMDELPQ